jgi:hypothetical protein
MRIWHGCVLSRVATNAKVVSPTMSVSPGLGLPENVARVRARCVLVVMADLTVSTG